VDHPTGDLVARVSLRVYPPQDPENVVLIGGYAMGGDDRRQLLIQMVCGDKDADYSLVGFSAEGPLRQSISYGHGLNIWPAPRPGKPEGTRLDNYVF
jgi:hypothetical protein